ncbi:MAG: hypothetical protein AB7E09_02695 [Candidatus Izemoplasmatales bacterium]
MNIRKLKRERELLIEKLDHAFKQATGISEIKNINDNLFIPLSQVERKQLHDADGNELSWKTSRVNSSACLLLNTFSGLRQGVPLVIDGLGTYQNYQLEAKLKVLNTRGNKANIDMVLSNEDSVVYIESKFIELFYYESQYSLSDSYFIEENYPSKSIYEASIQLFSQFNYFNADQLIKHTIGIYRDCIDHKDKYNKKSLKLMNLSWELHDSTNKFEDSFILQLKAIKEASVFTRMFNKLMKKVFKEIGIDFEFIYMNYFDFTFHQSNILGNDEELSKYLSKRYYFYKNRKEYIDNKIEYLKSHIENDLSLEDLEDFLDRFKIINIHESYQADKLIYKEEYVALSDAMILIGPEISNFPINYDSTNINEFLHIVSPLYYNHYTTVYLSNDLPRIKHCLIR